MFVLKSKHESVKRQLRRLQESHAELLKLCDRLTSNSLKLKAKYVSRTKSCEFTKDEVNLLIRLAHPDKHNNEDKYTKLTQKLIMIRNDLNAKV